MTKSTNHNQNWVAEDDAYLAQLYAKNIHVYTIAELLDRTPAAVYARASVLGIKRPKVTPAEPTMLESFTKDVVQLCDDTEVELKRWDKESLWLAIFASGLVIGYILANITL